MQIKQYEHKVQYYETDQMKIVHHSNYIRWFEEARTDFLEQIGCSYAYMEELGIISPVLAVACEYKTMTRYGETVIIIPKIEVFNGIKLELSYTVMDAKTQEVRVIGSSKHCFLNEQYRPIALQRSNPKVYEYLKNAIVIDKN